MADGFFIYEDNGCLTEENAFRMACRNCKRNDHAVRCTAGDPSRSAFSSEDGREEIITRSGRTTRAPINYIFEVLTLVSLELGELGESWSHRIRQDSGAWKTAIPSTRRAVFETEDELYSS